MTEAVEGAVSMQGRAATLRRYRVMVAARALRLSPDRFVGWVLEQSSRVGDPVEAWAEPWLVCVISYTELHRSRLAFDLMRSGWRLVLTYHHRPVAWVMPVGLRRTRPTPTVEQHRLLRHRSHRW